MFIRFLEWIFGNGYTGTSVAEIARDMNTPLSPEEYARQRPSDEWLETMRWIEENQKSRLTDGEADATHGLPLR